MKDKAFVGASLVAGITASFCCVLPIVFALAGTGIVGASAFFAAWRPLLLGITFVLLGLGFYFSYRKPKQTCSPGSACERPGVNQTSRLWLWITTVLALLFAAFPYYSGPVANLLLSMPSATQQTPAPEPEPAKLTQVSLIVDGMTCPACAKSIEDKLRKLRGVQNVVVSYQQSRAEIEFDTNTIGLLELEKAIEDAGFKIRSS